MSRKYIIALIIGIGIFNAAMSQTSETRIHHSVFFKLKWKPGSSEEKQFLEAAGKLAAIPGVEQFQSLKQVSKNNKFQLGLSMEFASQKLYEEYLNHPDHVSFVEKKWMKEVEDYMEIDYQVMQKY